jgi:GT2 family glycosyltransferase
MDVEFGERVLRAGRRIGYEPRSVVYHDVDWSRLAEAYFKRRHELQGRSRAIYKASGVSSKPWEPRSGSVRVLLVHRAPQ